MNTQDVRVEGGAILSMTIRDVKVEGSDILSVAIWDVQNESGEILSMNIRDARVCRVVVSEEENQRPPYRPWTLNIQDQDLHQGIHDEALISSFYHHMAKLIWEGTIQIRSFNLYFIHS